MGSLTFSEMATIAVIVLIVFGPKRLPELARRAGAFMTKVRDATRAMRDEFQAEYEQTIAPLEEVRRDLEAARRDVADAAKAVGDDLEAVADISEPPRAPPDERPAVEAPPTPLEDVRKQLQAARDEIAAGEASAEAEPAPGDAATDEDEAQ